MVLREIFTDFNNDGLAASLREFFGYFVKQFFPFAKTQIERLYFSRFDYPLLVFPMLLLAIIGLVSFWRKPRALTAVLAAVPAGLLFFSYFHYWVYWLVVLGILFLYVLLFERSNQQLLRNYILLMICVILFALPYFINFLSFSNLPSAHDYALRLGIAEGREPGLVTVGFAYIFYAFLAAIIYFVYWPTKKRWAVLLWTFLIAAVVVWNVQLVTGFVPTPNNWRRTISPFLYIIIFLLIYELAARFGQRKPNFKKYITIGVIFLSLMVLAKKVINVIAIYYQPEPRILAAYDFPQEIKNSWRWINNNLGKEPKIIADSFLTSIYLNVYTSAKPFLPIGNLTSRSTAMLEERYLAANKLFDVPAEILRGQLTGTLTIDCSKRLCPPHTGDNLGKNLWFLYWHFFRVGSFSYYMMHPQTITPEYIVALVDRYKTLKIDWKDIPADYVYLGPWERQFSQPNLSFDNELELIYKNSEVEIYKIKR